MTDHLGITPDLALDDMTPEQRAHWNRLPFHTRRDIRDPEGAWFPPPERLPDYYFEGWHHPSQR